MKNFKKNRQYPPPTGPYKICPKNSVPWSEQDHVRIQISVGQPNYEGDKFYAFLEWANTRFETVTLVVSDTLQRWNMLFEQETTVENAWNQSRQAGDEWLVRNGHMIETVSGLHILRWDDCLHAESYSLAREKLETMNNDCLLFQFAMQETKNAFWNRNMSSPGHSLERRNSFEHFSDQFLLEELAVFSDICARPGVDAYAGSWLEKLFNSLRQQEGAFFNPFRKDWLQIDFTRNRGYVTPDTSNFHEAGEFRNIA